ncbi:MAG: hypothetical protein HYV97_10095, partial [Bdellovibrio sp.]|nr:hypothetical protein [Bdellovibrio sp.]
MFNTLSFLIFCLLLSANEVFATEQVCHWSSDNSIPSEKTVSASVVKFKLCTLPQIAPQLIIQTKANKTFTKLIPTDKNTIRFAMLSFVNATPEKFLSLMNDHATIRRL